MEFSLRTSNRFNETTFFQQDEPLNFAVQLGECKDLEDYCTKAIPDECSFKAVNSDGEIIGVFLNGIVRKPVRIRNRFDLLFFNSFSLQPPNAESSSLASKTDHEKFKKIMGLMDSIDSKYDAFKLYPDIDSFVDGKIWAVDPRYRGHGIAGQLSEKTLEYMREKRIQIYQVLCSSHYSARVCEKMNFTEVFQLPFSEYVDEDGKQVLNPEKPHVAARIFTIKAFP